MNLSLSSLVVFGLLLCLVSGQETDDASSSVAETPGAQIEDKVAEVMDELEVLNDEEGPATQDDNDESLGNEAPGENSFGAEAQPNGALFASPATNEVELIEEAKDNKFTLLGLFHGRYYESFYSKINSYLVDRLEENDNTKDNMEVALEWLANLEQSPSSGTNLIRALKQFTALTKIGGANMCTKNSYGILRKNDLATRGRAHKRRTKLGAMRRVDKMIYEYSIQHAIDCFRHYPQKFANKRAQLDKLQLSYVEPLFDHIFQTILRPASLLGLFANPDVNKNIDPTELVRDIRSLNRADVGEATLEKLRFYARNDPDSKYLGLVNDDRSGKYLIRDDKIKALYEKYIVSACQYYIEQLGFDILIPMRFDLQMLEPEDRYLLDNDQVIDFYAGYAKFRACNLLVYQDREALARHVVKAVHRQSQPKV